MAAWALGGEFYMDGQNYSLAPFEKMCDGQRSFVIDAWKIPKSWINPSMVLSPDDPKKVSSKFPYFIIKLLLLLFTYLLHRSKVVIVWRMPDKVFSINFRGIITC